MSKKYATQWRTAAHLSSGVVGNSRALLRNTILSISSVLNRRSEGPFLRCLYCHYVFDDQKYDFENLIIKLKQSGQFVDTDACIEMLQGKKEIDKKYYHLSFDDGFRNNFTNAFPILKRHDVPAIFFVPSSLIDANYDVTRKYCLETTHYNSTIEMLRLSDMREMVSEGYQIGSHTKTHARFSVISKNSKLMEDEILGSKKELENKLDVECKYISWPFGKLSDSDEISLQVVKDSGYVACFGAYRGTVQPASSNIFSIPRHHFEVQWPIQHVLYFARGNMEIKI